MQRRICSVWSWPQRLYHYYAAPSVLDRGEDPKAPSSMQPLRRPLGDPPERLLRELPIGSLYLGRGAVAQGEIVVRPVVERRAWDA
jgi:hypothetical protein